MIEKDKIRVLIITKSPWADNNAAGNTLSNFFGGWKEAEIYNIYCREELPQNDVCAGYYNITEKQIIKNFLTPAKIGQEYSNPEIAIIKSSENYRAAQKREKETIDYFRNKKSSIFVIAREVLWMLGTWHNKKLDSFLDNNKFDIIFSFAVNPLYLQKLIIYSKKRTNAGLVLYFSDDIFYKKPRLLDMLYRSAVTRIIKKSVNMSDTLYGASQKLCDEYEKIFDKKTDPLYKGCSFEEFGVKKTVANPIKIVYAGNLFYERWKTLGTLADEIEKLNGDAVKITLEIYTTTKTTPEIEKALNTGRSSALMGAKPYDEIKNILAGADIVLHVESFQKEAINTTRLSFSTKIIDCMQSGSCLMAIGPSEVASIEYLKNINCAIVITDFTKIAEALSGISENPGTIVSNALKLRAYAMEHHDINIVRNKIKNDFEKILQTKDKPKKLSAE